MGAAGKMKSRVIDGATNIYFNKLNIVTWNKSEVNEEEIQTPVESVFGGMFKKYLLSQLKTIQL